jgi:hypothetical protein
MWALDVSRDITLHLSNNMSWVIKANQSKLNRAKWTKEDKKELSEKKRNEVWFELPAICKWNTCKHHATEYFCGSNQHGIWLVRNCKIEGETSRSRNNLKKYRTRVKYLRDHQTAVPASTYLLRSCAAVWGTIQSTFHSDFALVVELLEIASTDWRSCLE